METFQKRGRYLYTSDIPEVIASGPESNNEASVFFGEPVSHDRNETRKQEGVEDTNEDLHEEPVELIRYFEEAGETQESEKEGQT